MYVVSRYSHHQLCIVLGSALTSFKGWHSTNEEYLDITKSKDWKRMFGQGERVSKMVAEHVFEHLTVDEMISALRLCYKYLNQSGTLLIAVPDGNHPDETYRIHTGINGIGADASDHKQFISFESFSMSAEQVGFQVKLIEGYNSNCELINDYSTAVSYGPIIRSRVYQDVHDKAGWSFPDSCSSLIMLLTK